MAYPASSEYTASSSFTGYTAFSIFTGSITQVGNQSLSYFTGYQASSSLTGLTALSGFTGSFPKHEFKISHIMSTSFIEETSHTRTYFHNQQLDNQNELKVQSPDCVCIARTPAITLPEDPYHPTLELTIDTGTKVYELSEKLAKRIPCFRRANFALVNSLIACPDWSNLYLSTNINEAGYIFYNILNEVYILKFQTNLRGLTKSWHDLKM